MEGFTSVMGLTVGGGQPDYDDEAKELGAEQPDYEAKELSHGGL